MVRNRGRSRRTASFRGARSGSRFFSIALALIVAVGVALVIMSRGTRQEAAAGPGPKLGDHWHAVLGVNICGDWLSTPDFQGDFHSHADGLIHAHPRSSAAAGRNATLDLFFERSGGNLSADSMELSDGRDFRSGVDECDGEKGELRWAVNGAVQNTDPGDHIVDDGEVISIAFVAEGDEVPTDPPWADQQPTDVPANTPPADTETSAPPG